MREVELISTCGYATGSHPTKSLRKRFQSVEDAQRDIFEKLALAREQVRTLEEEWFSLETRALTSSDSDDEIIPSEHLEPESQSSGGVRYLPVFNSSLC